MLNIWTGIGRLTKDPELRRTPEGTSVTSFSLAIDRDYKDKSGNKETDFIDIVCWRNTAEYVCRYIHKGDLLCVEGRLQVRNYTDKNGNSRRICEIIAENVYGVGNKRETEATVVPRTEYKTEQQFVEEEDVDGELPF